jgi:hypothetical protein
MINYSLILTTKYFGKQWFLDGDSYDGLTWLDSSPKPTQEELDVLWQPTLDAVAAKEQAAADAKQSALDKLMALGLTKTEALALGVK